MASVLQRRPFLFHVPKPPTTSLGLTEPYTNRKRPVNNRPFKKSTVPSLTIKHPTSSISQRTVIMAGLCIRQHDITIGLVQIRRIPLTDPHIDRFPEHTTKFVQHETSRQHTRRLIRTRNRHASHMNGFLRIYDLDRPKDTRFRHIAPEQIPHQTRIVPN